MARRRAEAETLLCQQEEKEYLEHQVCKEAKIVEQKRLEEEMQRKQKEAQRREEERQRNLAHRLEADHAATVEKQWYKNWNQTFLLPSSFPSDEEMNLIDLLPLTKRQYIHYLPKETLEARQRREELAREIGTSVVSGRSPCERCADFRILYILQNLP